MDPAATEVVAQAEHAAATWDVLAGQVQAFIQAWEARPEPPDLAEFVADGPTNLRRLVLCEIIKVDLDYRWSRGRQPRTVEDYLAAYPELASGGPPCDLLYEEFHVRKRAGDPVDPQNYLKRFPGQAAELGRLLGLEAPHLSTSLFKKQQVELVDAGGAIDDFDLFTLLGKGAFARVFLARQRSMQRLVALKVSGASGDEPQTLAQLDHAHIVRVFDQRLLPERGLRLLYMQYVSGGTLQSVLDVLRRTPAAERDGRTLLRAVDEAVAQRGELPPAASALRDRLAACTWPEAVCWLGARLAEALDYAHRQGVLHRDVKPANVLLTAEGSPKLADFNVSFSCKLDGANPAAFFGGSLAYMSPEQLEAFNPAHQRDPADLDGRADLYSLCVVLWELLAGRRPFRDDALGEDWGKMLARMTDQRRKGIGAEERAALPPGLPAGLAQVLRAGLDPDPDRRPPTGAALARELDLCLRPRARDLLHPPAGDWRSFVRRFALPAVVMAIVLPNALGALFNIAYNRSEIIAHIAGAEPVFWNVQAAINGVAFPAGIAVMTWLTWPAARAVRRADVGRTPDPGGPGRPRLRCLVLGDLAAVISVVEWLLAGLAFPLLLCAFLGPQPPWFYVRFVISLALCGLIAAVHPFFAATFLAVRALLPALMRGRGLSAEELGGMERLKRRTGLYLLLAAAAPMLTVAAWAATGSEDRTALAALSAVGLVGFGAAFVLARAIQGDLDALGRTAGPAFLPSESGVGGLTLSPWGRKT